MPELRPHRKIGQRSLQDNSGMGLCNPPQLQLTSNVGLRTCRCCCARFFPGPRAHRERLPINPEKVLRVFYGPDPQR